MSFETWPTSLPRDFLLNGYSGQMGDGRLITKTDYGPAKMRRRSSFIPDPLSGNMMVDATQLRTLQTFVKDSLEGGTRPFIIRDPVLALTTNIRALVRFVDLPSWSAITPDLFTVSLKLEQLDLVQALPPVFSTRGFNDGREAVFYQDRIEILEGRLPIQSITVAAGSLPAGLSVSNGFIAGTPVDFGSSTFTLRVRDGDARTVDAAKTINIRPPGWIFWQDGSIIDPVVLRSLEGASYTNRNGVLTASPANLPRFDYDANGSFKGVLIEPAARNIVPNALGTGAVAGEWGASGTPGRVPANWGISRTANGITATVIGSGSEEGIPFLDMRYSGTATANGVFALGPASSVGPTIGETWTSSFYARLIGGSMSGFTTVHRIYESPSNTIGSSTAVVLDDRPLREQRHVMTRVLNAPANNTTGAYQQVRMTYVNGAVIDVTIRYAVPQLERGPVASSPILKPSAPFERAADIISFDLPTNSNRVAYTFDDGSSYVLNNVGLSHTIPLDFARRHIRRIDARPMP